MPNDVMAASGQVWKFWVSSAAEGAAGLGMFLIGSGRITLSADLFMWSMLLLLVIGVAAFVWSALAIRCPLCSDRWLWRAMSQRSAKDVGSFIVAVECPACHATADDMVSGRAAR